MSLFHKWIFITGAKKRNPSLWYMYQYLKIFEQKSPSEVLYEQEHRLKNCFLFAFNNSTYYRTLWGSVGIELAQNWNLDNFKKLPVINKHQLLQFNEAIHCPKNLFTKNFFCETSGTTGQVLTFYRNEEWDSFNRASIFRGLEWHNIKPWEYSLYFWGYNTKPSKRIKIKLQDWLLNRYRIFDYNEEALIKLRGNLKKTRYIEGYSSMIYELAKIIDKENFKSPLLKFIKGTSEKIYPHYKEATQKAFGINLFSEYGSAESGIIAFECPMGNMHINQLGVFVETDDSNSIIVTNLVGRSFPTIRYKLGDSVKLASPEKKCTCGLPYPILEEVTGRIGNNILGTNKKYPSLTLYYIFKNLYFEHNLQLNYQGHQYEPGVLELWIKEALSYQQESLLYKECKKYFADDDMRVIIQNKTDFRQQKGKLRDFISYIE